MYTSGFFRGKKITVMGLGLLGRGIGDVRFLAEEGAELIVTDIKTKEELKESLNELSPEKIGKSAENITFVLGEHKLEDFRNRDFILKAASVPLDSPYISEARENNIPIEMSTSLFVSLTPAMVIGVTGTRGKSTVTQMLYEILKNHEIKSNNSSKIFLGGNIRGVSTLSFLKDAKAGDVAVLELDSWQLQGFGERKISPHVSVFTTFFSDHMNYYKNNLDDYLGDKANIFLYQKAEDILVIGEQAKEILEKKYGNKIKSKKIIAGEKDFPKEWKLKIPGEHNSYDAALALAAARELGIPDDHAKEALENFMGVPGRLELVKMWRGREIYNDTTATTPDATRAALRALGKDQNIILIMGGADKGLDMSGLIEEMKKNIQRVILLKGTGSDRIRKELENIFGENIYDADTLPKAVVYALEHSARGDIILFSPAFASFGMFKNEFDRGDLFNRLIEKLEK